MGARISAIEYFLPEKKVSNYDLKKIFPDYDFESFENKVGIKSRYVVDLGTTALDLAERACNKLFSSYDKDKIDFIIYCTQSPEYILPTTACILQDRLGLEKRVGAFDYNLGCSGYTYGLSMAKSLIYGGMAKSILLVTSETYSKYIHPKDRPNRAIFGDAATATIVEYSVDENVNGFVFGTDGSGFDKLIIKNGGSKRGVDINAAEISYGNNNIYTENNLYMNGPEVFNFGIEVIPNFVGKVLENNNMSIDSIDQFIFHQANAFMLNFMRKKLKISTDKFYVDLSETGNTVSCTIPIALKNYSQSLERTTSAKEVMLVGFGVGLSWCGGVIKLNGKL